MKLIPPVFTSSSIFILHLLLCSILTDSHQMRYGSPPPLSSQSRGGGPGGGDRRTTTVAPPDVMASLCVVRRTFAQCMQKLSGECKGDLGYHSSQKVIEKQMKQSNCTLIGPVYRAPTNPVPPSAHGPAYSSVCTYQIKSDHSQSEQLFCSVFGDPHLQSFAGVQETCRIVGAWPLVDNKYFSVQATSEPVGSGGTAISKVTLVIKSHDPCTAETYVTYQAATGTSDPPLPSTFDNGLKAFGSGDSVRLIERNQSRHIEIVMTYVNTSIIIRYIGRNFSVIILSPRDVVTSTEVIPGGGSDGMMQLCRTGCPVAECIAIEDVISLPRYSVTKQLASSRKHRRRRRDTRRYDVDEALILCHGLVDFYLDSCVFDVMTTGEEVYSLVARTAYEDAVRFYPSSVSNLNNRTTLSRVTRRLNSTGSAVGQQQCVTSVIVVVFVSIVTVGLGWRLFR